MLICRPSRPNTTPSRTAIDLISHTSVIHSLFALLRACSLPDLSARLFSLPIYSRHHLNHHGPIIFQISSLSPPQSIIIAESNPARNRWNKKKCHKTPTVCATPWSCLGLAGRVAAICPFIAIPQAPLPRHTRNNACAAPNSSPNGQKKHPSRTTANCNMNSHRIPHKAPHSRLCRCRPQASPFQHASICARRLIPCHEASRQAPPEPVTSSLRLRRWKLMVKEPAPTMTS